MDGNTERLIRQDEMVAQVYARAYAAAAGRGRFNADCVTTANAAVTGFIDTMKKVHPSYWHGYEVKL